MRLDTTSYRKDIDHKPGHGYGSVRPNTPPNRPTSAIRRILIHTTNNPQGNTNYVSEAVFLRDAPNVSAHYVVSSHDDTVVQLLDDTWIAWHAGDCADNAYENSTSIGIEIAWAVGKGALPQIAIENVTALVRLLIQRYPTITGIDTHRAQAIPKGRKVDPSGWSDAAFAVWRAEVLRAPVPPPPTDGITADATILAAPRATPSQMLAYLTRRPTGGYTRGDLDTIVRAYVGQAVALGVDPLVAVAQMIHETGALTSWWAQRPRRNPAGIGVTGETSHLQPKGMDWRRNDAGLWVRGLAFASWAGEAIPAHLGRLLAYATRPEERTPVQAAAVQRAFGFRDLPLKCHGSARVLRDLGTAPNAVEGCGWASPGDEYGARIAAIMRAIAEVAP